MAARLEDAAEVARVKPLVEAVTRGRRAQLVQSGAETLRILPPVNDHLAWERFGLGPPSKDELVRELETCYQHDPKPDVEAPNLAEARL